MVDFRIDVVVDPGAASPVLKTVETGLDQVEKKAKRTKTSLTDIGREGGTGADAVRRRLKDVEIGLEQTEKKSTRARKALGGLGSEAATGTDRLRQNLVAVQQELDDVSTSASNAEVKLRQLTTGTADGPEKLRRSLNEVERELREDGQAADEARTKINRFTTDGVSGANKLRNTLSQLFAGFSLLVVLRQGIALLDTYNNIENRLRVVTNSQAQLTDVTQRLLDVSNRTRASFQDTVELYSRISQSGKELGRTQEELIQFTESLNQAIILSGASSSEAQAGLIQLSQGLASGALRGDELRSVLEQLPVVADVIAKRLGVTRGQLRLLGAEGKISAQAVIDAFADAREELAENFGKTVPTIGQAMVLLKNQLLEVAGQIDESSGISSGIKDLIVGVVALIGFVGDLGSEVQGLDPIFKNFLSLFVSIELALLALAATNPFFAIAAAVGSVVIALGRLNSEIDQYNEATKIIEEGGALSEFGKLGDRILTTEKNIKRLQLLLSKDPGNEGAVKQLERMQAKLESLRAESKKFSDSAKGLDKAAALNTKTFDELIEALDQEQELLTLSNKDREIQNKLLAAEQKIRASGIEVTDLQRAELESRLQNIQSITDQNKVLTDLRGSQEEFERRSAAAKALLDAGTISLEEYNRALADSEAHGPAIPDDLPQGGEFAPSTALPNVDSDAFEQVLAQIQQETDLLAESNSERLVRNRILQEEQKIQATGRILSDEERLQLEESIRNQQRLTDEKRAEQQVLDELFGKQQRHQESAAAANRLYEAGTISAQQYAAALGILSRTADETSNQFNEGLSAGLTKITNQVNDLASFSEHALVQGFQGATDALAELATTGKASFTGLIDSFIEDLTRLALQKALLDLIGSLFGGGGASGFTNGDIPFSDVIPFDFFADGGDVTGGEPIVVGEEGPEIWTPPADGTIIPNDQAGQFMGGGGTTVVATPAPAVNLSVINVLDKKEILSVLSSVEGEKIVVNHMRKNKSSSERET